MDNPLLLIGSWITGSNRKAAGQDLAAQLERIRAGAPILPTIQLALPGESDSYTAGDLAMLAEMGLPFAVKVNNAVGHLTYAEAYPDAPWVAAGEAIGKTLAALAAIYPDPPRVLLLDNNEGWQADYAARNPGKKLPLVHGAVNSQLPEAWRVAIRHVGYNTGPAHHELGRGWWNDEMGIFPEIELDWDGGSPPSGYIHNWRAKENDTTICGPQSFSINVAYGKRLVSPRYWQEVSIWHGQQEGITKTGLTPERYRGYATFCVFVARPRVLREFLSSATPFAQYEAFTRQLYALAEEINASPIIRRFWLDGEHVISPEPSALSRDRKDLPEEHYRNLALPVPSHPASRTLTTGPVPVWAAALQHGGEFLVYAHAPLGPLEGVVVTVPGWGDVELGEVTPEGDCWWLVGGGSPARLPIVEPEPEPEPTPTEPGDWVSCELREGDGSVRRVDLREIAQEGG